MSSNYPSDITREQFAKILPVLESARKQTKPRKADLYRIFCAILYILKSGCQWRMLPNDFPKWSTVYYYFTIWSSSTEALELSPLELSLKKINFRLSTNSLEEWKNQFCYC